MTYCVIQGFDHELRPCLTVLAARERFAFNLDYTPKLKLMHST